MMIDSSSTRNFIYCKLAKALKCFIYLAPEFQVMIVDGGTTNYLVKFHNHSNYKGILNSPVISITMGGVDVVLGVQWLQ